MAVVVEGIFLSSRETEKSVELLIGVGGESGITTLVRAYLPKSLGVPQLKVGDTVRLVIHDAGRELRLFPRSVVFEKVAQGSGEDLSDGTLEL